MSIKIPQVFLGDYYQNKAIYEDLFKKTNIAVRNSIVLSKTTIKDPHIELPPIELCKFDGDYKNFATFIDQLILSFIKTFL